MRKNLRLQKILTSCYEYHNLSIKNIFILYLKFKRFVKKYTNTFSLHTFTTYFDLMNFSTRNIKKSHCLCDELMQMQSLAKPIDYTEISNLVLFYYNRSSH